jgi:hypothetical protein
MENRNTIFAVVLSAAIIFLWQYFVGVPKSPPAETPLQAFVRDHFTELGFQALFAGGVVIVASALFMLREHGRRIYACLEILFGFAAGQFAANTFFHAASPEQRVQATVAAIGGIYIIIRGLDNLRQGQDAANAKKPLINVTSSTSIFGQGKSSGAS